MKIEGCVKYKKALVLDESRVKNLNKLLLKYASSVKYEATTINDTHVTFTDLKELLSFENYKKNRIVSLLIYGYTTSDRKFRIEIEALSGWFVAIGYFNTLKCYYTFSSLDEENLFRNDISSFLQKATAPYWFIGKIRFWGIIWLLSTLSSLYNMFNGKIESGISLSIFIIAIIILLSSLAIVALVDRYILENLFPPIAFMWGEEKERQKKIENYRGNIFWTIVIGIIVGIATTWITNQIF